MMRITKENQMIFQQSTSFQETNGAQLAMRTSAKNILYVVVNSRAYAEENLSTATPLWRIILYSIDGVIFVILVIVEILSIKKYRKRISLK